VLTSQRSGFPPNAHSYVQEAYESLLVLRETPIQAARELFYANAQIQAEVSLLPKKPGDTEANRERGINEHPEEPIRSRGKIQRLEKIWHKISRHVPDSELDEFQFRIRKTNYFSRLWQLFRDERTRRATIAALVVMIGQQLCGVFVCPIW
jgi:hypothetical protein